MMEESGIFRSELSVDGNFTVVPNAWIRDKELSATAKLLLVYLMSHKIGYEIRDPQIIAELGFGRHALRGARTELVEKNWLVLSRVKKPNNELGGYRYELAEARGHFSTVDDSTVERSTVDNQPHNKNTNLKKTNIKNTNEIVKRSTQLPKDWKPSDSARESFPTVDIDAEAEAFVDYHLSKGSLFKDWDRAFSTWCRNTLKWTNERNAPKMTNAQRNMMLIKKMEAEQARKAISE